MKYSRLDIMQNIFSMLYELHGLINRKSPFTINMMKKRHHLTNNHVRFMIKFGHLERVKRGLFLSKVENVPTAGDAIRIFKHVSKLTNGGKYTVTDKSMIKLRGELKEFINKKIDTATNV